MSLKRRYKLVFTQETITDEGVVVKEKAPIIGQICESEHTFSNVLVPELVISETILRRLYEGLISELHNPNKSLNKDVKNIVNEAEINEPLIEQTIIPLNSQIYKNKI